MEVKYVNPAQGDVIISTHQFERWLQKFRAANYSLGNEPYPRKSEEFEDDVVHISLYLKYKQQDTFSLVIQIIIDTACVSALRKLGQFVSQTTLVSNYAQIITICSYLVLNLTKETFSDRLLTRNKKYVL